MFEKRVVVGKQYCVFAPGPVTITASMNNTEVKLVNATSAGKYFFIAPTTKIYSSIDTKCIFESDNSLTYNIGNNPSWLYSLKAALQILLGETAVIINLAENKLIVHTDRADETQLAAMTALLERVLPKNIEWCIQTISTWLPAEYIAVEYLESTRKQWIDTLYYPCWDSVIDTEGCFLNNYAHYILYASVDDKTEGGWNPAYFVSEYANGNRGWVSHGKQSGITEIEKLFRFGIKQVFNASKDGIFIDGLKIDNAFEPTIYRNVSSLYIFARNYQGGAELPAEARIWSFKVSERGVTKRDFVPCLDPTGAPCMFDLVTCKPFYNSGTGDFLYPTESTTYALRRELPDWGKLTEHGLRRLYHAPADYKGELYDYALANGYKPII